MDRMNLRNEQNLTQHLAEVVRFCDNHRLGFGIC
jgi:hypothetical protein